MVSSPKHIICGWQREVRGAARNKGEVRLIDAELIYQIKHSNKFINSDQLVRTGSSDAMAEMLRKPLHQPAAT